MQELEAPGNRYGMAGCLQGKNKGPGAVKHRGPCLHEKPGSDLLWHGNCHTTIGAEHFHFRVRNGIGWFLLAMAARQNRKILFDDAVAFVRQCDGSRSIFYISQPRALGTRCQTA
jgi:hypothetical protein